VWKTARRVKKIRVENHTFWRAERAKFHTMSDAPLNVSAAVIRRLRNERGWTQPELAAACHLAGWEVSRDVIARIEGGTKLVRDSELAALAAVFGVSPVELIAAEYAAAVKRVQGAERIKRETLGGK